MKHVHKTLLLVISIALLFLAAQATRFENEITIRYENGNFTTIIDGIKSTSKVEENFTQITAKLQKAMLAENGIGRFSIMSDGKILAEYDPVTLHLFGNDLTGKMIKGKYPHFRKTFGDWDMDRFRSNEVVLYNASLPSNFYMELTLIGRGYKTISFNGIQSMRVEINDGYLDNNYGICYKNECHGEAYKEFMFPNVKRIANFFIEAFLLALIIILVIRLIAKRADSK